MNPMKDSYSLAQQAYTVIKKDILTCALDPGSRIAQPELVKRYDFGITPIREALKRLEHEGFIQSIPRYGYLISPVTIKDVEDLYDLRLVLESSSVQKAIASASDTQLEQLLEQANFTYVFKDRDSYLQFLDQNIAFHTAIARAAGNQRMAEIVGGILGEMTRIFNLGLDLRDSAAEMRAEHIALVKAMLERNAGLAVQLIEAQITSSRVRVLEMINQRLSRIPLQEYRF
jgi:DNA-binding GntR family transcriptional regulator